MSKQVRVNVPEHSRQTSNGKATVKEHTRLVNVRDAPTPASETPVFHPDEVPPRQNLDEKSVEERFALYQKLKREFEQVENESEGRVPHLDKSFTEDPDIRKYLDPVTKAAEYRELSLLHSDLVEESVTTGGGSLSFDADVLFSPSSTVTIFPSTTCKIVGESGVAGSATLIVKPCSDEKPVSPVRNNFVKLKNTSIYDNATVVLTARKLDEENAMLLRTGTGDGEYVEPQLFLVDVSGSAEVRGETLIKGWHKIEIRGEALVDDATIVGTGASEFSTPRSGKDKSIIIEDNAEVYGKIIGRDIKISGNAIEWRCSTSSL